MNIDTIAESLREFFEWLIIPIKWLINIFYSTPISQLTFTNIVIDLLTLVIIYFILRWLWSILKKGITIIKSIFKKYFKTSTEKASKIRCSTCGRTLDKCICQKNNGLSSKERLKLYKKTIKATKKANNIK